MKTNHILLRLHKLSMGDAEHICSVVQGFMGNSTNKNFDCRVETGDNWFDIVSNCTDNQEKIAHAVAWGCVRGMLLFIQGSGE